MGLVVFLRGVNVGGNRTFRPAALARELADLDVVNVGAAGTFVVRGTISPAALRAEVLRRLPFEAEVMICRGGDLVKLAAGEHFAEEPGSADLDRFVSVLAKRPRTLPPLPLSHPAGDDWQVRVVGVVGNCALSLWRRLGQRPVYPNEVVEKHLGVAATTRNWNTLATVCRILADGGS
jgi:uncharacterized protein (DUF1697 family)